MNKYKIFKGLGNKRRLMIVEFILQKGETTLDILSQEINLSYRSTSKHLLLLENIGIIERENRGRNIYYSVRKDIRSVLKKLLLLSQELLQR